MIETDTDREKEKERERESQRNMGYQNDFMMIVTTLYVKHKFYLRLQKSLVWIWLTDIHLSSLVQLAWAAEYTDYISADV